MVTLIGAISFVKQNPPQKDIEGSVSIQSFSGGLGTESSPYLISTKDDLTTFANNVNGGESYSGKYFKLTTDIKLLGEDFTSIGKQTDKQRYVFAGNFDGNGFQISNFNLSTKVLSISAYSFSYNCYGLFGYLTGVIKNLALNNFSVTIKSKASCMWIGGLVGISFGGSIENCKVTNFSVKKGVEINAGGPMAYDLPELCMANICGYGYPIIKNCYAETINCEYTSSSEYFTIEKFGITCMDRCSYSGSTVDTLVGWDHSKAEIKSCIVKGDFTSPITGAPDASNFVENCKSSAYDVSGLSWSAVGGKDEIEPWYYDSRYNSGWPKLRVFIHDWTKINFSANPSNGGTITGNTIKNSTIQIPSDATIPSITTTNSSITILGQMVTATPDTANGYFFKEWEVSGTTYTAKFELKKYTLTFATITIGNESISPSASTHTVTHGTVITSPSSGAIGTISYKINGITKATYDLPTGYYFEGDDNPGTITQNVTITPKIEVIKYNITLKAATGSNQESDTTWIVNYGDSVTYRNYNMSFTYGGNTITYTASSGYKFDNLTITKDGNASNTNALSGITGNIVIQPTFARWYTVTFNTINNTTAPTSAQTMEVKENGSITATLSNANKTLTYSYNNQSVVYTASQYYILSNGTNSLQITSSHSKTITPQAIFYACIVTMGGIDTNIGIRTVTGDGYGTSNDGIFIVEFNTTVSFNFGQSGGIFTYTYTFSSGQVVTYTMKESQYAMQYTINAQGERLKMLNGLNERLSGDSYTFETGVTSKIISPTFGLKQYVGNLA